jgi:3-phytase
VLDLVITESDYLKNVINNESNRFIANIPADAETQPINDVGDAADDPAIWAHPSAAEKSLVLGTHKKRGLLVYSLDGSWMQGV